MCIDIFSMGAVGGISIFIIIVAITALSLFSTVWAIKLFNRLIVLMAFKEEGWSGLLGALKCRRDLILIIIKTVESVMPHESEMLRNSVQTHWREQTAYKVAEMSRFEAGITTAIAAFKADMVNYPDLKADENLLQIQEELSELEEDIEKTRLYYNATVRDYNMEMSQFPANFIVRLMGFQLGTCFETNELLRE